jgi:RNAse (barnase) inhibitor barstar
MTTETLFKTDGNPFHLVDMSLSDLDTLRLKLTAENPDAVIRLIRGLKTPDSQSFFDHMATAFHFPHYFGANWDALKDCLSEQRYHTARPHLLIISHASRFLARERRQVFDCMLDVLAAIHREWQEPRPDDTVSPLSFKFLFQEYGSGVGELQQRFGRIRYGVDWWRGDGQNLIPETLPLA